MLKYESVFLVFLPRYQHTKLVSIGVTCRSYVLYLPKRQGPGRTRSSEHLLDIPRTKLASFGDRSFRVVGPRLWNALPIDIKCCGTLSAFRKALKTHIFKAYYC